ncbi:hypothetical protein ACGFJT_03210 [Actinomadura geliboluensis]|uniref:hypothetical protein n=1 Tax=Actinomadura geliboluensis TaxID=882440 RepID=UPI00371F91C2
MALKIQVLKRQRGKTRIKPRVTATCRTCGKPRGLNHTCRIATDFKKRKAAAARRAAADRKRQQAARRKAAAAARRQNTPSRPGAPSKPAGTPTAAKPGTGKTGAAHDYHTCTDNDCRRFACIAWKEAFAEGAIEGYRDGSRDGYREGSSDGYRRGWNVGYDAGLAACPRPHQ